MTCVCIEQAALVLKTNKLLSICKRRITQHFPLANVKTKVLTTVQHVLKYDGPLPETTCHRAIVCLGPAVCAYRWILQSVPTVGSCSLCLPLGPAVCAYRWILQSVPTVGSCSLCLPLDPAVCAYRWILQSVPTVGSCSLCLPLGPAVCAYRWILQSVPTVGSCSLCLPLDPAVCAYRWAVGCSGRSWCGTRAAPRT